MATKELIPPVSTKSIEGSSVLVLGIGNYLMGDEGIGVHIAQRMEQMHLDSYIKVADFSTGSFLPMSYFEHFDKVIFVDGAKDEQPAGTISHVEAQSMGDFASTISLRDVGFKETVHTIYSMEKRPEIHIIEVSIDQVLPMHIGLSEDVNDAIDRAVWKVIELAQSLHGE